MTDENHLLEEMLQEDDSLTDKQRKILVAATEMFAEKGFAATSTNEIAKKAGVAEGTIFRHYKTKKDLLLSIVTPMMVKMLGPIIIKDLNKVLNKDFEHFEDFVRAMIKNRQEFLEKNLKVIQIFIQEIPFHHELREQFIEHIGKKVIHPPHPNRRTLPIERADCQSTRNDRHPPCSLDNHGLLRHQIRHRREME